jgi:hypothetical protein
MLHAMSQYVVSLLAERPEHELRATQDKARAEVERLQVEIELIEQALQRQTRRTPRVSRSTTDGSSTRARVLDVFRARADEVVSPANVIAALREDNVTVSSGAIRNMIRRLVDDHEIEKLREGAYKLASRNGANPDAEPGLSENGAGEPPSTATQPQEGTQEVLGS